MKAKRILYYALWPVEATVWTVNALAELFWKLIIVSNPLFLALYLLDREKKRKQGEQGPDYDHRDEVRRRAQSHDPSDRH